MAWRHDQLLSAIGTPFTSNLSRNRCRSIRQFQVKPASTFWLGHVPRKYRSKLLWTFFPDRFSISGVWQTVNETCPNLYRHFKVFLQHPGNRICMFALTYIHTNICICIHAHIHTYIHTCIHTSIRTCMHTYMHTCIRTCIHTYKHTYMHTYIRAYVHTCMHTYIHTYIHTHICAYMHTYINAYVHMCIRIYVYT